MKLLIGCNLVTSPASGRQNGIFPPILNLWHTLYIFALLSLPPWFVRKSVWRLLANLCRRSDLLSCSVFRGCYLLSLFLQGSIHIIRWDSITRILLSVKIGVHRVTSTECCQNLSFFTPPFPIVFSIFFFLKKFLTISAGDVFTKYFIDGHFCCKKWTTSAKKYLDQKRDFIFPPVLIF